MKIKSDKCIVFLTIICLIELLSCDEYTKLAEPQQVHFLKGLKYESLRKPDTAIINYSKIKSTTDDMWIWKYDFQARCYFIMGDYENALEMYCKIYQKQWIRKMFNIEDFEDFASIPIKENDLKKSLTYSDILLANVKSLQNRNAPVFSFQYYSSGTSEGFIRKYFVLKKLGKEMEAESLKKTYFEKYEKDIIENPWERLEKITVECDPPSAAHSSLAIN